LINQNQEMWHQEQQGILISTKWCNNWVQHPCFSGKYFLQNWEIQKIDWNATFLFYNEKNSIFGGARIRSRIASALSRCANHSPILPIDNCMFIIDWKIILFCIQYYANELILYCYTLWIWIVTSHPEHCTPPHSW
jgi:hypothetical protein